MLDKETKEFLQEIAEEVLSIQNYIEEGESEKLDRVLEDTKNIYVKILKKIRGS